MVLERIGFYREKEEFCSAEAAKTAFKIQLSPKKKFQKNVFQKTGKEQQKRPKNARKMVKWLKKQHSKSMMS